MELDEEREKRKSLENAMSEGEKALKKRVNVLGSNLEQLTQMYHQLVSQKSLKKIDAQVILFLVSIISKLTENELKKREERIIKLEVQLNDALELVNWKIFLITNVDKIVPGEIRSCTKFSPCKNVFS